MSVNVITQKTTDKNLMKFCGMFAHNPGRQLLHFDCPTASRRKDKYSLFNSTNVSMNDCGSGTDRFKD